jgi:hypothetical protein
MFGQNKGPTIVQFPFGRGRSSSSGRASERSGPDTRCGSERPRAHLTADISLLLGYPRRAMKEIDPERAGAVPVPPSKHSRSAWRSRFRFALLAGCATPGAAGRSRSARRSKCTMTNVPQWGAVTQDTVFQLPTSATASGRRALRSLRPQDAGGRRSDAYGQSANRSSIRALLLAVQFLRALSG